MPRVKVLATILFGLGLGACAALKSGYQVPKQHPDALPKGRPSCSAADCHGTTNQGLAYARFDHSPSFSEGNHRNEAYQDSKVCAMCHAQSFCNDCHVTRTEMKPSVKNSTDSYKTMPHRGDYLTRHRIDARIDPMPCFRCHGNPKSSKACAACHGK